MVGRPRPQADPTGNVSYVDVSLWDPEDPSWVQRFPGGNIIPRAEFPYEGKLVAAVAAVAVRDTYAGGPHTWQSPCACVGSGPAEQARSGS